MLGCLEVQQTDPNGEVVNMKVPRPKSLAVVTTPTATGQRHLQLSIIHLLVSFIHFELISRVLELNT